MIKIKQGNILNCKEDIICHQVNVQGYMGGGLARQLADKYQGLEISYSTYCNELNNSYSLLSGNVYYYLEYSKIIANLFSQRPNFDTDYIALEKCLRNIKLWAQTNDYSIAIPYGIGCGIANGDWNKVYKLIEKIFNNYDVTLYKLEE
jgi:O-acetyl-ADP-ribose deacetylase (regulator of RNase III)